MLLNQAIRSATKQLSEALTDIEDGVPAGDVTTPGLRQLDEPRVIARAR